MAAPATPVKPRKKAAVKKPAAHPGLPSTPPAPAVEPLLAGLSGVGHEFLMGPIPVMGEPVTSGYARMTLVVVELAKPLTSTNAETVTGMAG